LSQETEKRREEMTIYIPPGPRLGSKVIELEGVSKAFGDRAIYEGLSLVIPPGAIVGMIGPNGAGKTTLLRLITGQEKADAGTIRIGETVKLAYVDQSRDVLDPQKTVFGEISGGEEQLVLGERTMNSRAYVASFNFHGSDQQKQVQALSGGERNRVHLARMLKEGANVLLLDEPTNDLDVNTLRALEEALEQFAGCAVVVSHDRWFLDRIATHILAVEEDGTVAFFAGNCADYEADRRRRLGHDAEVPHRMRHRRLTR
jgi:energy-dependent translational throttle protein EttA